MAADETRHRYASLDAMRGLAAFAVVVYHLQRPYAPSAYIAVDFFFVLSGFVIARAYGEKLASGMSVAEFMKARYLRLYPLFLLGSLYGLVQLLAHWQSSGVGAADLLASMVSTLFMLPSPSFLTRSATDLWPLYPLNGPAWSLFWELTANLVFAITLFKLQTRSLVVVAVLSLVVLVASVFVHKTLDLGWEWRSIDGGLARVFFSFTLGMIIYRLRSVHKIGRTVSTYFAIIPIAAICAMLLLPTYSLKFALLFCILISPLIVFAGTMLEVPPRFQRVCIFLGYLSYPIYMCHRGFTEAYAYILRDVQLPPLVYILLFIALISGISFVSAQVATVLTRFALSLSGATKKASANAGGS
ncbi:acyltransferase family protein [Rhizobium tubonense]|uniref:Acyltransferase n=1 Tax=Rhizobium tubonense TaxID=484088 RepID=A0A2W4CPI9_9HYPH|nr:acyltransferase [Rhizobium tubonense]PZM07374.1 acyltransferase [Rhizobium tubonense]